MSYGEWKSRGKGWASLEIDSKWNFTFDDIDRYDTDRTKANRVYQDLTRKNSYERQDGNMGCRMSLSWSSNPTEKKFYGYQGLDKGWTIITINRDSHEKWIAFNPGTIEGGIRDYIKKEIIGKTLKLQKEWEYYTIEEAVKEIESELKELFDTLEAGNEYNGPLKGMRIQFSMEGLGFEEIRRRLENGYFGSCMAV